MAEYNEARNEEAVSMALELKALFADYEKECKELVKNYKPSVAEHFKRYVTMDAVQSAPVHKNFYLNVEKVTGALVTALEGQADPYTAQQAMALFLQEKPQNMEGSQRSWLIAVEGIATVLVPHLSLKDAEGDLRVYEQLYDWAELMPKQRELYEALCLRTGRKAKKPGLFARLISGGSKKG